MRVHHIQTLPTAFQALLDGRKKHEIFHGHVNEGDFLQLLEWEPNTELFSGRAAVAVITFTNTLDIDVGSLLHTDFTIVSLDVVWRCDVRMLEPTGSASAVLVGVPGPDELRGAR